MADIVVNLGRDARGSILLDRFKTALPHQIKKGFIKAGTMIERQTKKNLSGQSHTRFPGNGNPFIGTLTGRLKQSVNSQVTQGFGDTVLRVGPHVEYAAIHEFGGNAGIGGSAMIPPRAYLFPSFEQVEDKAMDAIEKTLFEPIR